MIALAIVAVAVFVVWRLEVFAKHYVAEQTRLKEQELSFRAAPPKREYLPSDLEMIADQETEAWAREQVRAAIQDEYEARGDWDAVRKRIYGA